MAVKRKSNWYIYLISFGITLAMIIMAVIAFKDYLFPESAPVGVTPQGTPTDGFTPDSSMNLNVLSMVSESDSETPELFMIVSYNAVENRVTFIPITNGVTLKSTGRTLPNIVEAQGGKGAVSAVSKECGITIDGYVSFDRSTMVDFFTLIGNVDFEVPKTIAIKDGSVLEPINAGKQIFTPERAFRYLMLAEFPEGESYRFNTICTMLTELVNQNYRYFDGSLLDRYAQEIIDNTDTNLNADNYKKSKAAMLNTVQYGINPAEYYIPYGEYNDDGAFIISENSVTTIRQKAGQY